ncbi:hypothetical protein JCM10296v2_003397 [Rhodotorula toruloides]
MALPTVLRKPAPQPLPEDVILELLELLQPIHSLKHLRFLGFLNIGWGPTDMRIASIDTSTLHEDVREANRPYNPAAPTRFNPYANVVDVQPKADEMTFIKPGGTSSFIREHPHLNLFLEGLKGGKIVEVFYRTDFVSERELRLRREGPGEEREGVWWIL